MPVNESNTIQYTVNTSRVPDGTILYWKTTGNTTNSDIVGGNTGSITITNNQAIFNVTIAADETADNVKTLGISLLTGSLNGTQVTTTAAPIVINDTSNTAPPPTSFTLYVWGDLTGDNTSVRRSSPVQIGSTAEWLVAGLLNVKNNGTLWAWGRNQRGQLGLNDLANRSSPTQVGSSTDWIPYSGQESVAQNDETTLFVKNNGTLWSWGYNGNGAFGVLGLNDQVYRSSPTQVGLGTTWSKVSIGNNFSRRSVIAIKTDGTLWAWGDNQYGQLGINSQGTHRSSPTQVGSDTTWSKILSGGCNMLAIKTNGTLWAWGLGFTGANGQNDGVYKSSPTQVGALTTWTSIGGNGHGAMGISNGQLYYWGGWFQLVNGGYSYKSSPTQIGSDTNWLKVSAGNPVTLLKTNGTLWSAGYNGDGVAGLNNITAYTSPKQIGSKTSWVGISSNYIGSVQSALSSE
jgi:hypothetical protein